MSYYADYYNKRVYLHNYAVESLLRMNMGSVIIEGKTPYTDKAIDLHYWLC